MGSVTNTIKEKAALGRLFRRLRGDARYER